METRHAAGANLPLVVGISGASGVIYGVRLLEILRDLDIPSHLVLSRSAEVTLAHETDLKVAAVRALATRCYAQADIGAAISSGSFRTRGMVVAPCSIRSMAEIASGVTSGLLTRAADVVLKERRRLVLMVRETPLHAGHLRSPWRRCPTSAPSSRRRCRPSTRGRASIAEMVDHTVGRVLDLFDIDSGGVRRWKVEERPSP